MLIMCLPDLVKTFNHAKNLLQKNKSVEVDVKNKKRTNDQNAYYWILCTNIADFLTESGCTYGEFNLPYTSELVHEVNKCLFGIETTTKMDVKDFCDYTTKITSFWQERTNGMWYPPELPTSYLIAHGYDEKDFLQ